MLKSRKQKGRPKFSRVAGPEAKTAQWLGSHRQLDKSSNKKVLGKSGAVPATSVGNDFVCQGGLAKNQEVGVGIVSAWKTKGTRNGGGLQGVEQELIYSVFNGLNSRKPGALTDIWI